MRSWVINLVLILTLLALVVVIKNLASFSIEDMRGEATLALGVLLLSGYLAGQITDRAGLSKINGYLFMGILLGPLGGLLADHLVPLTQVSLDQLHLIDHMALGLIAFTAGGEIRLRALRRRMRSILWTMGLQSMASFIGVTLSFLALTSLLPLTALLGPSPPPSAILAVALILGTVSMANSPATTIAIINECRARGPVTELVLGITILKDVVVLTLFTFILALAKSLLDPRAALDSSLVLILLWEVGGSLAIGALLGALVGLYIQRVRRELPLIVLGLAFVAVYLGSRYHLSGLIICIACGIVVENFFSQGEELIRAVERYSLPVYVIFFAMAGAAIDLGSLKAFWPLALALVVLRLVFTFLGTGLGNRLGGEDRVTARWSWTGFVGQAGVTIGLATIIGRSIPEVGPSLQTLIMAAVAINQVVGPVAFKRALFRLGEAGRRS